MVQRILNALDFDFILDNYAGQQIPLKRVTKTTSNYTGEETLTEGSAENVKCYVMKTGQNWNYQKHGFLEKGDMVALFKYADSVQINDIVTVNGEEFRVAERFDVPGVFDSTGTGTTYVYTAASLFLISD